MPEAVAEKNSEGIQVKRGDGLPIGPKDTKKADIVVPDRRLTICSTNVDFEESVAKAKQSVKNLGKWEPGTQGFLVEVEAFLTQFFGPKREIPWGELSCILSPMASRAGLVPPTPRTEPAARSR